MENSRYRLYAALSCPFAHRVRLVRLLLGLQDSIQLSLVTGQTVNDGFIFHEPEPEFGVTSLRSVYAKVAPDYNGKYSVPLLMDREQKSMVGNESLDLAVLLAKTAPKSQSLSLLPEGAEQLAREISDNVTVPVYTFLFASDEKTKDEIRSKLYLALDHYEEILQKKPYLMGDHITLPDCVLWPSLIRYDNVYARQFGITGKTVKHNYPALTRYIQRIWDLPCGNGGGDVSNCDTTTIGKDANLVEAVRMYWQSEILAPPAKNDPKAPVPPLLSPF